MVICALYVSLRSCHLSFNDESYIVSYHKI